MAQARRQKKHEEEEEAKEMEEDDEEEERLETMVDDHDKLDFEMEEEMVEKSG